VAHGGAHEAAHPVPPPHGAHGDHGDGEGDDDIEGWFPPGQRHTNAPAVWRRRCERERGAIEQDASKARLKQTEATQLLLDALEPPNALFAACCVCVRALVHHVVDGSVAKIFPSRTESGGHAVTDGIRDLPCCFKSCPRQFQYEDDVDDMDDVGRYHNDPVPPPDFVSEGFTLESIAQTTGIATLQKRIKDIMRDDGEAEHPQLLRRDLAQFPWVAQLRFSRRGASKHPAQVLRRAFKALRHILLPDDADSGRLNACEHCRQPGNAWCLSPRTQIIAAIQRGANVRQDEIQRRRRGQLQLVRQMALAATLRFSSKYTQLNAAKGVKDSGVGFIWEDAVNVFVKALELVGSPQAVVIDIGCANCTPFLAALSAGVVCKEGCVSMWGLEYNEDAVSLGRRTIQNYLPAGVARVVHGDAFFLTPQNFTTPDDAAVIYYLYLATMPYFMALSMWVIVCACQAAVEDTSRISVIVFTSWRAEVTFLQPIEYIFFGLFWKYTTSDTRELDDFKDRTGIDMRKIVLHLMEVRDEIEALNTGKNRGDDNGQINNDSFALLQHTITDVFGKNSLTTVKTRQPGNEEEGEYDSIMYLLRLTPAMARDFLHALHDERSGLKKLFNTSFTLRTETSRLLTTDDAKQHALTTFTNDRMDLLLSQVPLVHFFATNENE